MKVLIVDDIYRCCEMIAHAICLVEPTAEVSMCSTPGEAERLAAASAYDLALVDYHFGAGQINGVELIERLPAGLRCVLVTAYAEFIEGFDRIRGRSFFVEKDPSLEKMAGKFRSIIRLLGSHQKITSAISAVERAAQIATGNL